MSEISRLVGRVVEILASVAGTFHNMNPIPDRGQDRIVDGRLPLYRDVSKLRSVPPEVRSGRLQLKQDDVARIQLRSGPENLLEQAVSGIEVDGSDQAA